MPIRRWFRDKCWYWEYDGVVDGIPIYKRARLLKCHYITNEQSQLSGDSATHDWRPSIAFVDSVAINGAITACNPLDPNEPAYPTEDGGRRKIAIITGVRKVSRLDKVREVVYEVEVQ